MYSFSQFISVFHVYPIFSNWPSIIYFIAFFICISYVFFLYIFFVLTYITTKHLQGFTFCSKLLSFAFNLNLSFLYIPVLGILLSIASCDNGKLIIQTEIACTTSQYIIYFVFGLTTSLFLFVMQLLSATLFFSTSNNNKNFLSREPCSIILFEQIVKTALVIVSVIIQDQNLKIWLIGLGISIFYTYVFCCSYKKKLFISHFTELVNLLFFFL